MTKEMTNVGIAFKILENDEHLPMGYKKSSGHLIFDVKMDFTQKARWVKDGHRTPDPETSKYAGVVSRESIRILLAEGVGLNPDSRAEAQQISMILLLIVGGRRFLFLGS